MVLLRKSSSQNSIKAPFGSHTSSLLRVKNGQNGHVAADTDGVDIELSLLGNQTHRDHTDV
jgi:hypothetical protein